MFYVGLDVHTRQITMCVLDDNGKLHERHKLRTLGEVIQHVRRLRRCEVCYEASTGYGRYFESLSAVASRVAVAHPGLLRLIFRSRKKNDRADAEKLAKLLYIDQVPQVHVPSAGVRAWREMITFRKRLIEKRTRAKNGMRCVLRSLGIEAPRKPGIWTRKGMDWLRSLTFDQPMHALKRDMLLEEIQTLSKQVKRVEDELMRYSKDNTAVAIVRTIPGVGPRTSEAVVAFIDDPRRFPDSRKVGSYFGLVPSQDQSGNVNRMGRITKEGSATVRHLLTEAVWQSVRRSPTVRAYQQRIQRGEKDRKKISVTATAHYLVRVMWSMLNNGTEWQEHPDHVTAAA